MLRKVNPYFDLDSKLSVIPLAWLRSVEHKIIRKGTCWLWQGHVDWYGEPLFNIHNATSGKRTTKRVKVFVMELFWEGLRGHEITHSCGNLNCLNPKHLVVSVESWRNKQRKRIVAEKSKRIARYVNQEKSS